MILVTPYSSWIVGAGVGLLVLTVLIARIRRANHQRRERLWWERRILVPKRNGPLPPHPRQPVQLERRRFPRRSGNPVSIELFEPSTDKKIGEGRVLDRSMGGVCISSTIPFEVGSRFDIRPLSHRHSLPTVPLEIRNVSMSKDHWRLGCQFLRRPSWSVLMHLR